MTCDDHHGEAYWNEELCSWKLLWTLPYPRGLISSVGGISSETELA